MINKTKNEILINKETFVGIDIAKENNFVTILNKNGVLMRKSFVISNTKSGFEQLDKVLKQYDGKSKILIGGEPTGHYGQRMEDFFKSHSYDFVHVGTATSKRIAFLWDNLANKNDAKDSWLIAKALTQGCFLEIVERTSVYQKLFQDGTELDRVIKSIARTKTTLIELFDLYLPGYQHFFSQVTGKASLALLNSFGIRGLRSPKKRKEKVTLICKQSRGNISTQKAETIVDSLANVFAKTDFDYADKKLTYLLCMLQVHTQRRDQLKQSIEQNVTQTEEARFLLTVPATSAVNIGCILGQTGPLSGFSSAQKLLKFSGLTPIQKISGTYQSKPYLNKRGRKLIRYFVYKIALVSLSKKGNPFRFRHQANVKDKNKQKMVSLTNICAKIIRVFFHLAKYKEEFDPVKI